ncbi:L-rhamnose mutarotase [soil metagenome]
MAEFVTVRRTMARPGRADEYASVHSRIPEVAAAQLREQGILNWTIWRDGDRLVHVIVSRAPYGEIIASLRSQPAVDAEWNARIADLLSAEDGADVLLAPVWGMDESEQWSK